MLLENISHGVIVDRKCPASSQLSGNLANTFLRMVDNKIFVGFSKQFRTGGLPQYVIEHNSDLCYNLILVRRPPLRGM